LIKILFCPVQHISVVMNVSHIFPGVGDNHIVCAHCRRRRSVYVTMTTLETKLGDVFYII